MTLYLGWEGGRGRVGKGGEGEDEGGGGGGGEGDEKGGGRGRRWCEIVMQLNAHTCSVLLYLIVNTCCTCLVVELRESRLLILRFSKSYTYVMSKTSSFKCIEMQNWYSIPFRATD